MAGRVYGKAYPITGKDAKSYNRVSRRLRPNPIGVTNLAAVNGRGAYARSAREMAEGKTRSQRIARAREVFKNGEKSMSLLKNRKSKSSASTKRKKVAGTRYYKTPNGRYQNSAGKFVKTSTVKKASRLRRNASVGYSDSYASGWHETFGGETEETPKKKTRKKSAATKTKGEAVRKKKVVRKKAPKGSVGKYRRVKLKNPRTGRSQLSYMYRDPKTKKLRRIPTKAILKSKHKSPEKLEAARERHAARVKKTGDVFVANKRKKTAGSSTAKRKRAGRRLAAYNAALRAGKSKKAATQAALLKVPLSRGDSFRGETKEGGKKRRKTVSQRRKTTAVKTTTTRRRKKAVAKKTVRRKRKKATSSKKKATTTRRKKATTRRRKSTAKKAVTRRKKKATTTTRRRRKSTTAATPRKRRKSKAVKSTRRATRGRRKSSRRYRRNGQMFRKNNFLGHLQAVLKTGLFVATGFLTHRIVTNLVADKLLATTLPDNEFFQQWKKPVVGLGVLGLGVAVSGAVAKRNAMELGAGMVASFLQSVIVSGINAAGKPELLESVAGYSNSKAWDLRGVRRRRRGLRGAERHAVSIGPRYTPVGQFQQAAAGFQQAAAGQFQQAAAGTLGEYFTASPRGVGEYYQATGEYFAPNGMKGVGAYEPAGELAMQASAGVNQVIRDGVRPDGDLDRALDLAEAAAGVGEVPQLNRVPQQSQWVPNGPLWAGETAVRDTQAKSEVSAGILARTGSNGILSS